MAILAEHQFEILPSENAANGFVFGIGAEVSVNEGGFDPGEVEWLTQDTVNTRRGVTAFGRDVPGAKTWAWESHANGADVYEAVDILERFADAWMPDALVREPSAVTCLRYRIADRVRRIYGRPRRYAAPPTNLILGGYNDVSHDFATVDAFTYDDLQSNMVIPYVSTSLGGGIVLPATMPIIMEASEGNGAGQFSVSGNARAYPIIRFNGPWINPSITTDDWTLAWTGSIPDGDYVEIDARPWVLTVLNAAGASEVEGISRQTWLEDVWFAPQSQPQVTLGGVASSGSATCEIKWRNTWKSL